MAPCIVFIGRPSNPPACVVHKDCAANIKTGLSQPSAAPLSIGMHETLLGADEIDAIAAKRESAQREMERRIVAQMLTCLDDLAEQHSTAAEPDGAPPRNKHVVIIGVHLLFLSAMDSLHQAIFNLSKVIEHAAAGFGS